MASAEERLKFFGDNYDIIANYILNGNKKIFLGNKNKQKCRFCGRIASDTKFRMEAHAIPELVGNKILFTNYECDECNQKFSDLLEDHLAAYLSIWRTLMQIRGKRGIPKYKKNSSQIYVDESKVNIITNVDNNILQADEKNRELKIEGIREPYIPIAVYKCFVKMALSIIPDNELSNVDWALEWVGESSHINSKFNIKPLNIYTAFTPGPSPYGCISTFLFRRKKLYEYKVPYLSKVPYLVYVITFGNFLFQINLPRFEKSQGQFTEEQKECCFPSAFNDNYKYGKTIYGYKDFSSREIIKGDKVQLFMNYQEVYENINNKRENK